MGQTKVSRIIFNPILWFPESIPMGYNDTLLQFHRFYIETVIVLYCSEPDILSTVLPIAFCTPTLLSPSIFGPEC